MNRVFADTVGLVAVWNRNDQWFAPATTVFHQLQAASDILITTSHVLLECGNALSRTSLRDKVDRMRSQMESAGLVMRRLNIQQAFTNDNHFRAAGFETLFD